MRHLLAIALVAACVDSSGMPEEPEVMTEDPAPEPAPEDPTPPPPQDPTALLAQWQQCMTFEDFQTANMAGAWSSVTATGGYKCAACHGQGGYGFIATTNAQQFFDALKADKYMLLMFVTLATTAQGQYQVVVNERTIPDAGSGQAPHTEHPTFDASAGMAATRDFYNRTQLRCAAPL